jgi:Fe2+ or Zn2+ uptake regulation protein
VKASIIEKLREHRLKLTPQRMAIIDAFLENISLHPPASLIHEKAKKKVRTLSLSTVYAALKELSRHCIIKMLEFEKMENRYEGNIAAHINLVCKGCNKIMDYKPPISIDLKGVAKKARFEVTDTRLEYYGYCQQCKKQRPVHGQVREKGRWEK